jgi:hypothetical protein
MENKEIELDLSKEYKKSLKHFMKTFSDPKPSKVESNLFKMIFELGYRSGGRDALNKIKKMSDKYEATGKI